jgi:hypothetical protein
MRDAVTREMPRPWPETATGRDSTTRPASMPAALLAIVKERRTLLLRRKPDAMRIPLSASQCHKKSTTAITEVITIVRNRSSHDLRAAIAFI